MDLTPKFWTLVIMDPTGEALVKIHPTGQIEYGPNYEPDEAAIRFWTAMSQNAPYPPIKYLPPALYQDPDQIFWNLDRP